MHGSRGIVLISAITLVALFVASVLGIGLITMRQIGIARDIRQSAVAIVAADAGAEDALFEYWRNSNDDNCENLPCPETTGTFLGGNVEYEATYEFNHSGCPVDCRIIMSTGRFRGVQRAFRLQL